MQHAPAADTIGPPKYDRFATPDESHALYARNAWWWRFWQICYEGGPDYYNPDIAISWLWPIASSQADESTSQTTPALRFERYQLRSFLWPFNREENGDYDQRILRGFRANLCAPVVDAYTAHVFGKVVTRDVGAAPVLADVWDDVDMAGSNVDEWMQQGVTAAQIFGHAWAMIDVWPADGDVTRQAGGNGVRSLADEREVGVRPFVTWKSPLEVVDWEIDAFGKFGWVKLWDPVISPRERPGDRIAQRSAYRTLYADHWERTGVGEAHECSFCGAPVLAEGPNPLGEVPVEVLYRKRVAGSVQPVGVSALESIAAIDREIFNLMSQKQLLLYEQGFPFLAVPDPAGRMSRIDVSVHRAVGFDPGQGGAAPTYVAPASDSVRVIDEQIAALVLQIRAIAGLSRGVSEQSIAARSGDALLVETHDKQALLGSLAHEAEDFEIRVWGRVARLMGQDFATRGYVRYPERYDVTRLGDDLDEVEKYLGLSPPAAAKAEVLKQVTQRMLAHLPPERMEEIKEIIDAEAEAKAEAGKAGIAALAAAGEEEAEPPEPVPEPELESEQPPA